MTEIDKINKGFTNTTNCCYMNVCLQSLLSSPPFFNMLLAIGDNQEIMSELDEEGLLSCFVHLARYFNPSDQMDRRSAFAHKVIEAEKIF
jgi:ubiquitin C-terminal hydrolase